MSTISLIRTMLISHPIDREGVKIRVLTQNDDFPKSNAIPKRRGTGVFHKLITKHIYYNTQIDISDIKYIYYSFR